MEFPDLSALPPWAIVAFAISLALIVAVDRFGVRRGTAATTAGASAAQVAAVIVDPTALNHATAAVEGVTLALAESNAIAKKHATATERLAKGVEQLTDSVGDLRDEVIRSAAKM